MVKLFGREYTRAELTTLVGDMSQVAAVKRAELTEGRERGAGLIEVTNASGLSFSVLPGRALDIAHAHYRGMSLCFRGSTGNVGPAFYEPQGYGWMRGFFGGLLTTCGLSFVGHPEIDPAEENEELGLHGRLSFLPASQVSARAEWRGEDYVIEIAGKMREAVVFGTNLELSRTITNVLGERVIHIHDRIENLSVDRSPFMLLYHMNPGFPLLDAGSRFLINSERSTAWNGDREVGPEEYATVTAPAADAQDAVYVHRPVADADGMVECALVNERLALGLRWRLSRDELPLVNQWQHFYRGTYVTGIEPGNCSALGREWNRKEGTLAHLEPGEVREVRLEIGVLDGVEEIAEIAKRIGSG